MTDRKAWLGPSLLRFAWITHWVLLFAAMHTPRQHLPQINVSGLDKVVHFLGYALLALFGGAYARRAGIRRDRFWFGKWFLIYAMYAAADELLQPFVNRSADVADWIADVSGILAAFFVVYWDRKRE